jgi:hypothetical protein
LPKRFVADLVAIVNRSLIMPYQVHNLKFGVVVVHVNGGETLSPELWPPMSPLFITMERYGGMTLTRKKPKNSVPVSLCPPKI